MAHDTREGCDGRRGRCACRGGIQREKQYTQARPQVQVRLLARARPGLITTKRAKLIWARVYRVSRARGWTIRVELVFGGVERMNVELARGRTLGCSEMPVVH